MVRISNQYLSAPGLKFRPNRSIIRYISLLPLKPAIRGLQGKRTVGAKKRQHNDRMTMKQKAISQASPSISRRTGLDRRWISSTDHRPERRRGGDRRAIQKRSFSEPLAVVDAAKGKVPFPDIDPDPKNAEPDHSDATLVKQWQPQDPGATPTGETSEEE